jgi:serine/threonine-protein kinase
MPLTPGSRVGPYAIEAPLGAGGMGEVYRARDTALNREVAIKIIPDLFAGNAERMARFEREAQTLAALNHPNIAHVYGLESRALVMELVDGEDLAERLKRGALALDDALPIATQIVDALEAAHERGIVHRDLKPANIKVRTDGVVKVLDFGLAKALDPVNTPSNSDSNSPTVLSPTFRSGLSQQGIILGTAAYMSPEQAKGKPVDKRTDIWAFGCVLFEMLTGKMAFAGDNITEILAAVVRGEPDWSELPADTGASVQRLLRRCLTKDPKDRLSDIGVARLEIRDATDNSRSAEAPPQLARAGRRSHAWWMLAAGIIAGAMVAVIAAWRMWPTPPSLPPLKLAIDWPDGLRWAGPSGPGLAISPDGTRIAYVAIGGSGPQVCLQDLRTNEMRVVSPVDSPYNPFFSPDGTQIGFVANGKLWRAPVAGGTPFEIGSVDVNDRGVAWSDDGFIYSGGGSGISRIPESGGTREQITSVDKSAGEVAHRFPTIVPGRRGVLFSIFKGSLEDARVAVVDVTTKKWRVVLDRASHAPIYVRTGHLVYLRSGVLMAARFDPSRLEVTGPSTPVMSGVLYNNGGAGHFGVSSTGTIAYMPDSGTRAQADLLWVDRSGRTTATDIPRGAFSWPELSPDGTRLALESSTSQERQNIVVWDFGRHTLTPITRDSSVSEAPIWMPDGANLLFTSRLQLGALGRLFRQRADGAGTLTQITSGPLKQVYASGGEYPGAVLSETSVLYAVTGTDSDGIKQLDVKTGESHMLVPGGRTPRLSPDRRWLAYRTTESGISEIYVSPYPDVGGARWQVSTGGSSTPRWSRDSTELFYRGLGANRSHMYVLKVGGGATLEGARPQVLVDVPDSGSNTLEEFDVARDGRFLVLKALPQQPPIPHVIVNWFEVLRQAVPTNAQSSK